MAKYTNWVIFRNEEKQYAIEHPGIFKWIFLKFFVSKLKEIIISINHTAFVF